MNGNQYFLLGPTPPKSDKRKRNAFGILLGFGKAMAAYYRRKERRIGRRR